MRLAICKMRYYDYETHIDTAIRGYVNNMFAEPELGDYDADKREHIMSCVGSVFEEAVSKGAIKDKPYLMDIFVQQPNAAPLLAETLQVWPQPD